MFAGILFRGHTRPQGLNFNSIPLGMGAGFVVFIIVGFPVVRKILSPPSKPLRRSAVGVLAVENAQNKDLSSVKGEADAPLTNAQAIFGRVDSLEALDVAGLCLGEALDGALNAAGYTLIERCHVYERRLRPFQVLHS